MMQKESALTQVIVLVVLVVLVVILFPYKTKHISDI